ncbi:hypothetical protein QWY85_09490 [Neolewinella lacunae]|uniref:Quinol:cytochrome C oxidoreductase n=1 Tax=Neolewinella lacunae TaxID=1517758 RepID=A0A923PQ82_9BACT|nr:hypothetical protein [Neolewinella lacunae]MBC6996545.1 hypothetical protein [Neolewinella lacunae]MDN3634890.1 hypothetical protein [Neolewinella lacunae]
MENFVFSSRAKAITGGTALFGLLLLIASYFVDGGEGHHMRFWTNLLHNSVFFIGISFIACFAYGAFTTAYAGWFVQFKRVWEAFGMFLLPGLFLMGIIVVGLWMHAHHMYHWNDQEAVATDALLTHKSSFLNPVWFTGATIIILGVYYWLISSVRKISIDEDTNGTTSYAHHRRIKKWAAPMIAVIGFTSPFLIWQWIMSLDAHWYSTMFAWYASASLFVAMIALTIMLLIYLKSRGYFPGVTAEHFHDLGKYLFAISIFWTYVWFSQFMLIWYANVGEETIYFKLRMDEYPVLFWGNLLLNFIMPFFILMRNDTKRKYGTLFFASAIVFFGHWFDYFNMIKPGARQTLIEMEHHAAGHDEAHTTTLDAGNSHGEDHATATMDDHAADHAGTDESHGADHAGDDHAMAATGDHADDDHAMATTGDHAGDDHAAGDHGGDEHGTMAMGGGAGHDSHGLEFKSGYTLPGLLEIGIFLGFLGGFLFFVLSMLAKAPLEPKKDPYYEESLHHHT